MAAPQTHLEYEQAILARANRFTTIRGMNPRTRIRAEHASLAEAREWAKAYGDGRTMIYAITAEGRDAHIENA